MLKGGAVAQAEPGGDLPRETGTSFSPLQKVNPVDRGITQAFLL